MADVSEGVVDTSPVGICRVSNINFSLPVVTMSIVWSQSGESTYKECETDGYSDWGLQVALDPFLEILHELAEENGDV